MADVDTIRRREIRKRKILEHSESRLNRITSAKKSEETVKNPVKEDCGLLTTDKSDDGHSSHQPEDVDTNNIKSTFENPFPNEFDRPTSRVSADGDTVSLNGSAQRSSASDYYIFPKKVSDAETRSFVRSRCDARRNSTCTQMMMETLQFSSFSLALLRPWIAAILSLLLKGYLLFTGSFPFFQSLLLPFVLLEIAFCSYTKFESQVNSRQFASSFIPGVLLLFGMPSHIVAGFGSVLYFVESALQDLAVYMFSFVFLHFICEIYM